MTSPYREMLDPNNTLPLVSFDTYNTIETEYFDRHRIDIMIPLADGLKIGECDLIISTSRSHFDGIYLTKYWRGQGYGLASYLLAIETGAEQHKPFESQDAHQSSSAKNIWQHLASAGVAQVVEPFRPLNIEAHGQQLFTGKYVVPVL